MYRDPSHDAWDTFHEPEGTPAERAAIVVACCLLLCAVLYLLMDPYLATTSGDDVDHPVIVPATAAPAVDFEGT